MKKMIIFSLLLVSFLDAKCLRDDAKDTVYCSQSGLTWLDMNETDRITYDWDGAINYCSQNNGPGWRLPNINELQSISDIETLGKEPSIKNGFVETNADKAYWSSTTYPKDTSKAYGVDFQKGNSKLLDKGERLHVRCVK